MSGKPNASAARIWRRCQTAQPRPDWHAACYNGVGLVHARSISLRCLCRQDSRNTSFSFDSGSTSDQAQSGSINKAVVGLGSRWKQAEAWQESGTGCHRVRGARRTSQSATANDPAAITNEAVGDRRSRGQVPTSRRARRLPREHSCAFPASTAEKQRESGMAGQKMDG